MRDALGMDTGMGCRVTRLMGKGQRVERLRVSRFSS